MKNAILSVLPALCLATSTWAEPANHFATLYGGVATKNTYAQLAKGRLNTEDTFLTGLGLGTKLYTINPALQVESEGVLVQYSGKQHNQEANLGASLRWKQFPWNDTVNTTAAIGLGLSYALAKPEYETELNGHTERLLAYLPVEITLAPPQSDWEGLLHVHHRSTAFGTFGSEGGANYLTLGLRKHF